MRYVLKLEAIGDNHTAWLRHAARAVQAGQVPRNADFHFAQAAKLGRDKSWVARITGLDDQFGFKREFVRGQKDYTTANGTGSRGVMLYYFLEPGLYEISDRQTWKRTKRYFAWIVNDQILCELSREEAVEWLRVRQIEDF